jgi:hypothetical protein
MCPQIQERDVNDQARLSKLPRFPAYPEDIRRLVRRFRLTIPLGRPVVVEYLDATMTSERTAVGLPHAVRDDVLHLRTGERYRNTTIIPKACIISIRGLKENEGAEDERSTSGYATD